MRMAYPIIFKQYSSGQVGVFFPDVPEAITAGKDLAEARSLAADALLTALAGYIAESKPLPIPGMVRTADAKIDGTLSLPPRAAMKLALYASMREHGVSADNLAAQLGVKQKAIIDLLDLDHDASLRLLDAAFDSLGLQAELSVGPINSCVAA